MTWSFQGTDIKRLWIKMKKICKQLTFLDPILVIKILFVVPSAVFSHLNIK